MLPSCGKHLHDRTFSFKIFLNACSNPGKWAVMHVSDYVYFMDAVSVYDFHIWFQREILCFSFHDVNTNKMYFLETAGILADMTSSTLMKGQTAMLQSYLWYCFHLRNNSWKPECALSFNMGLRILVFYPELASMIYFDSDMSKSTNTVVYFDWKTLIYIYQRTNNNLQNIHIKLKIE
jgi:hypothetical protein